MDIAAQSFKDKKVQKLNFTPTSILLNNSVGKNKNKAKYAEQRMGVLLNKSHSDEEYNFMSNIAKHHQQGFIHDEYNKKKQIGMELALTIIHLFL